MLLMVEEIDLKTAKSVSRWLQKSAKKEIKYGVLHLQMFAEKGEIFVTGLSLIKIRKMADFA